MGEPPLFSNSFSVHWSVSLSDPGEHGPAFVFDQRVPILCRTLCVKVGLDEPPFELSSPTGTRTPNLGTWVRQKRGLRPVPLGLVFFGSCSRQRTQFLLLPAGESPRSAASSRERRTPILSSVPDQPAAATRLIRIVLSGQIRKAGFPARSSLNLAHRRE